MVDENGDQGTEELLPDPPVAGAEGAEETTGGEEKLNPAWNDLLGIVPSQLHSQVTPHLKNWDRNFQTKVNEVHQQYAPYKDYLDNNIAPDQINYALNVMRAIEERPQEVIQAITEYAQANGITLQQAAKEVAEEETNPEDDPFANSPLYKEMRGQLDTLAQFLVQQQQETTEAQEDEALDNELAELQEKFKDTFGERGFDEQWVLTRAVNDDGQKPLEEYVKEYQAFINDILAQQRKPGPKVVSGGGAAPSSQINPREMSDSQRRAYVAELLQAAHNNNS